MKKTGELTPDGKGGYSIKINDGGGKDLAFRILISFACGGATWFGGYIASKIASKLEKK